MQPGLWSLPMTVGREQSGVESAPTRGCVFFWLSKTVDLLCSPPLFLSLVLALMAATFARRSQARRAWVCGAAAFMLSYLLATVLVAGPLFDWVEQYDGPDFREDEKYDAVIVLGGFVSWDAYGRLALSEGGERLLRAYELLHSGRARYGLISGRGPGSEVEADACRVPPGRHGHRKRASAARRRSLNTRGPAPRRRQIVPGKLERLVLVTSAFHMERALQSFAAGWAGSPTRSLATIRLLGWLAVSPLGSARSSAGEVGAGHP